MIGNDRNMGRSKTSMKHDDGIIYIETDDEIKLKT